MKEMSSTVTDSVTLSVEKVQEIMQLMEQDYNFLRTITHVIQIKVDREKLIPKRIRNFEWLE